MLDPRWRSKASESTAEILVFISVEVGLHSELVFPANSRRLALQCSGLMYTRLQVLRGASKSRGGPLLESGDRLIDRWARESGHRVKLVA